MLDELAVESDQNIVWNMENQFLKINGAIFRAPLAERIYFFITLPFLILSLFLFGYVIQMY